MRNNITSFLGRYTKAFGQFSAGQKAVALIGAGALLLGGFMVFKWASAPTYAPLYSNLSGSDASAVVDQLEKDGLPYQLANGGTTVMVPQGSVYSARIAMSGEGLPASGGDSGYALLDGQSLSTSSFQEQTSFKRAMEGELSKTIEAINGVETAVVHLALPEKQVFTDTQEPTTASVLVRTRAGVTLEPDQVEAVVHLVASSIEGLSPTNVTVADSSGAVLTAQNGTAAGTASSQSREVAAFQKRMQDQIQAVLNRVVGVGNATANVTADLNFDKTVTKRREYTYNPDVPALSSTESTERYTGSGADAQVNGAGGVVGPDGQMDPPANANGAGSTYEGGTTTQDNAVGQIEEEVESAPGQVRSLHIGVVLDANKLGQIQPADVRNVISAATGISTARGDTIDVSSMPFDRSGETSAADELAKADAAKAKAEQMTWIRNGAMGAVIALIILLAWLKARRKEKARTQAANYMVEQLRTEAAGRAQIAELDSNRIMAELSAPKPDEPNPADEIRSELNDLVERQPEEVAALLRGWLVEKS